MKATSSWSLTLIFIFHAFFLLSFLDCSSVSSNNNIKWLWLHTRKLGEGTKIYKKYQLLKTALLKDPFKTQEDLIINNVSCS